MKNPKPFHKRIALILLAIFLPSLFPINLLYASNNGPNAFEAATFEPVDAADMVNLATGDVSYTLPLLNVPSPEGGYPLTLSYKAGVAMDQEASWVGLGWALNPGAINRNVNGFADDVENGSLHKFAYDSGGEITFQTIGIGGNYNGITLGVGAYWGSNKTFGGSVTYGVGPAVATIGAGSAGMSIGLGYSDSLENLTSNVSNGVSFESFKRQGSGFSSNGTGASSGSSSVTASDYNIQTSVEQYGGFGIYYGRTKVSYDLYKLSSNRFNGMFYPTSGNIYTAVSNGLIFDTNPLILYNKEEENILDINNFEKSYKYNNALLPNFDKYFVSGQGIGGPIEPSVNEEFNLYHEPANKTYFLSTDNLIYNQYINYTDLEMKLNSKLFFEFSNSNSSFLRVNRTNIDWDIIGEMNNPVATDQDYNRYLHSKTSNSGLYNEYTTNEGILLKNGFRKRTGKFVESFTNSQINSDVTQHNIHFIEAKNLNRSNTQTYQLESIGGFRITDTDGKTYHYSLPVIHFETYYKNFTEAANENNKFYEVENGESYATDWLLTAITGPDYVDFNNNNVLDKEDYGYWVEFDYGKWSDGYMWQSSSGNYDVVKGDGQNNDRYEYYRGRKQIYYLDAVRTRTHTAYFVKSIRKDAVGKELKNYNSKYSPGSDLFSCARHFNGVEQNYCPGCGGPGSGAAQLDYSLYNIPVTTGIKGYKETVVYEDFPKHYSLKLDKIILVKNNSDLIINKSTGVDLTQTKKAYLYKNFGFRITHKFDQNWYSETNYYNGFYPYVNNSNNTLKEIDIHNSANVIDVNDINGINITENAVKIINFDYDPTYPLMPNSPNSVAASKGRLTLNSVDFRGKKGVSYMPKYQFFYNSSNMPFDTEKEDGWGYHSDNPTAWSLREIITPTGGHLRIDYESDDYNAVASLSSRIFNKGLSFYIYKDTNTNELYFRVTKNPNEAVIENFSSFLDYFTFEEKVSLEFNHLTSAVFGTVNLNINSLKGQVSNIEQNTVTFRITNNSGLWSSESKGEQFILNKNISHTSPGIFLNYRLASSNTPYKGKGGGIRVKSISMIQNGQIEGSQKFYYNKPSYDKNPSNPNYKSSGSTSFVPYKESVIVPYASELPPPVILYKNVTVENYGKSTAEMLGKTEYSFETLPNFYTDANYIFSSGDKMTIKQLQNNLAGPKLRFLKYEIKTKFNDLGRLLSVKNYNNKGQLLHAQDLNYKTNLDNHGETGVKEESYGSRYMKFDGSNINWHVLSTSKISYPSKLETVTSTSNNFTSTVSYDKYDFLTGSPLETKTVTSDGRVVKIKTIPAYSKYQSMGAKVDDVNNANMLSQNAVSYSYLEENGIDKITGVGITTWNNEWNYQDVGGNTSDPDLETSKEKIWRKHKSYTWNGLTDSNGIFTNYDSQNGDDGFVWGVGLPQTNSRWKQISEVTLYDHYSMPLEVQDINNNKAATKMDVDDTKIIATGNAAYNEMFYSGVETSFLNAGFWIGKEVRNTNGEITNEKAHTGKFSIKATNTSEFGVYMQQINQHRAGKYKLSVWVHKDNAAKARIYNTFINDSYNTIGVMEFNGENYTAGEWVLKTHYFDCIANLDNYVYVTSIDNTTVYFDDLMIRPIASSITGYVYNENDELTEIISNNGLATRFEYDVAGRLIKTYVEILDDPANNVIGGFKLSSKNKINYKYMN
ncbi:RHS repeat domain-containing protein [Flavobacterium sp. HNIBRBA15423]|uniref:RHS repeat domain-containing protein n=1 Tax=Flavobacterium sp. HNIBRBA15423 TaxID=3458683 RepID=UPI0040439C06